MATKPSQRQSKVVDVPADNPEGTMERFTAGLRRVMGAPKPKAQQQKRIKGKHA